MTQYLLVVVVFNKGDYLLAVMSLVVQHFFRSEQQRFILKAAIVDVLSAEFYVLLRIFLIDKLNSLINLLVRGNIARIWLFDRLFLSPP